MDVSRLADRMLKGRFPTGVDRVGLAYLQYFGVRARAVVRFAGRWVVLSESDTRRVFAALLGTVAAPAKVLRRCVARGYALSWRQYHEALFLNTVHSGLCQPGYAEEIVQRNLQPVFFLHDLIPITHPEYCRPGEAEKHHRRLAVMLSLGRGIVVNSAATRDELIAYALRHDYALPPCVIAPLAPGHVLLPSLSRPLDAPYFVVLGTIEPRKNHLLLLNIWRELVQTLGEAAPKLVVIGQRGWECEQVVDMLERCEAIGGVVLEKSVCEDHELATWLRHAQALLFPSFAEGFGMPLIEALMLGVPVIASDLPVFHEIAGDIPEYLDVLDGVGWKRMILAYAVPNSEAAQAQKRRMQGYAAPTWAQHFVVVESLLASFEEVV